MYLGGESKLTGSTPREPGEASYVTGSPRQSAWSYQAGHSAGAPFTTEEGPDGLTFRSAKFDEPTALVGPATATLFMSSTAPDMELFVQIIDEAPDGSRYFLQRGMLRASHRAIMPGLSDWTNGGKLMYRPHRPHTNPTPIMPGKVYKYLIEIFPVGHVFRPGHRLVVKVHAPPAVESYYAYVPKRVPGINQIFHDKKRPSSVTLPVVPLHDVDLGPAPEPCSLDAVRCVGG